MENQHQHINVSITEHPLWRHTLQLMRAAPDFGYGFTRETAWFEQCLACKRESSTFAFGMLKLREELEAEDGYYLESQTIGVPDNDLAKIEQWRIPTAAEHEDVGRTLEARMRRCAHRALHLRTKTLGNSTAQLTEGERATMENSARIAATRIVLLRREKSVAKLVEKHSPKLLQ